MIDENTKTIRQDNFKEVVIPDDLQDLLKWTEVDQRIVDMMKPIITQYARQVDTVIRDECFKVAEKFGIAVDEERLVQALTDAQKFYCEGYRAGKAAAMDEIVRCKDCKHKRERNEHERNYLVEGVLICTSPDATDDCWNPVWPDHFCSYGERRADE